MSSARTGKAQDQNNQNGHSKNENDEEHEHEQIANANDLMNSSDDFDEEEFQRFQKRMDKTSSNMIQPKEERNIRRRKLQNKTLLGKYLMLKKMRKKRNLMKMRGLQDSMTGKRMKANIRKSGTKTTVKKSRNSMIHSKEQKNI
jgi:hypothetical protein